MESPTRVKTQFLAEDWEGICRALLAAGRNPDADLSWLLEVGLDRFVQDEAEWKALETQADEATLVQRQELRRRETLALLASMRASTIAAEIMMHELGEQVLTLGDKLEEHRRAMQPLREENAALETRLRLLNGPPNGAGDGGQTASVAPGSLLDRLRDLVSGRGGRHG